MAIVLASASPRRRELMEMFAAQNLVICPAKGEEKVPAGATPGETVEALARAKAREIAAARRGESEDDVIIGADTIVWHCGRIYGKPHSCEEAAEMLRSLSGETHEVYTGVCVLHGEEELCEHERTFVTFRKMSERDVGEKNSQFVSLVFGLVRDDICSDVRGALYSSKACWDIKNFNL